MYKPQILLFTVLIACSLCVFAKEICFEAENAFFGVAPTNCESCNNGKGFVHLYVDSTVIFTVNIPNDDTYAVTLSYAIPLTKTNFNPSPVVHIKANGHPLHTTSLPSSDVKQTITHHLPLRTGLNTIMYTSRNSSGQSTCSSIMMDSITIDGAIPLAARGATLPYYEMEAEDATYVGKLVGPDRTYGTLASEASGRKAVLLSSANDYVEFTLTQPANAFVVRHSIPDSADGSGIYANLNLLVDGTLLTTLNITSRYSWTYGNYPFTKNPRDKNPHHFYDETRLLLKQTLPKGAKFRLVGASPIQYHIDFVDFYLAPAPYSPPANSVSVIDFGADPTGKTDSFGAFQQAIMSGQKQQRTIWMPEGTYLVSQRVDVNLATLRGAGPWYSVLIGYQIGIVGQWGNPHQNVGLYDFAVFGSTRVRDDGVVDSGVAAGFSNSVFQNLWIEHTKCGMWLDGPFTTTLITGCTLRNTLADGINLHSGITKTTIEQSMLRNNADDSLAMWSNSGTDIGNTFQFNTIQLPVLANCIAIYGGSDNTVTDNIVSDSVTMGGGLHAGNRFNAVPLGGLTTFARNTITRGGGKDDWFGLSASSNTFGGIYFWAQDHPMTGNINVTNNEVIDSTYEAIGFVGSSVTNVVLSNIVVNGANYAVREASSGSASFSGVMATNLKMGGQLNCGSKFDVVLGNGNSGWSDVHNNCPNTTRVLIN